MNHDWTEQDISLAKRLWADGQSATEIAQEMRGGLTRNAVIGKLNRLGCTRRGGPATSQPTRNPKKRRRSRRPFDPSAPRPLRFLPLALPIEPAVQERPEYRAPPAVVPSNPVTLLELTDATCRWPIGDPQQADFHFCGTQPIAGSPYCNSHHLLAYNPPPRKTTLPQEERARRQRMERSGSARAFA